jgi:hypothetical protein
MITIDMRIQRISCSLLLSTLLFGATSAADAAMAPTMDAGRQIVIVIGPVAGGAAFADAVRLPSAVMLHRVTIEVVTVTGEVYGAAMFEAFLTATDASLGPLGHFNAGARTVELPRPLGLRLEAGESLAVRGTMGASLPGDLYVSIRLDCEPLDGPVSRLAVLPVRVQFDGAAVSEWRAPVDGRLMALAGVPDDMAGELILEDGETGAILWREILQPAAGEAFGRRSDVTRVGAQVRAGRLYRLALQAVAGDRTPPATPLVHALLMPIGVTLVAARTGSEVRP